jgi:hypothetical protein
MSVLRITDFDYHFGISNIFPGNIAIIYLFAFSVLRSLKRCDCESVCKTEKREFFAKGRSNMIVIQVRYFLVVHGLIETPLKIFSLFCYFPVIWNCNCSLTSISFLTNIDDLFIFPILLKVHQWTRGQPVYISPIVFLISHPYLVAETEFTPFFVVLDLYVSV